MAVPVTEPAELRSGGAVPGWGSATTLLLTAWATESAVVAVTRHCSAAPSSSGVAVA